MRKDKWKIEPVKDFLGYRKNIGWGNAPKVVTMKMYKVQKVGKGSVILIAHGKRNALSIAKNLPKFKRR